VVGGLQLGNVWLGVQPALGLEGDPMRLLFERDLTPHPQYAAFYLWLQRGLAADAVCHLGAPAPAPPAMHQRRQPSLPPPCEAMCRELSLLQPWLCFFFCMRCRELSLRSPRTAEALVCRILSLLHPWCGRCA